MCGIVGLYTKNPALQPQLGRWLAAMLVQMTERGPDSAGFAIYHDAVAAGAVKITLQGDDATDWDSVRDKIRDGLGCDGLGRNGLGARVKLDVIATHAVATIWVDDGGDSARDSGGDSGAFDHASFGHASFDHGSFDHAAASWIEANIAEVKITSVGSTIEIFKEKGLPDQVINQFNLRDMGGTHALGHTRMATESAVTTEHSHPFNTGLDLCLVHNGSLSNHNRLREKLKGCGIRFQTDNDSEVAAGYLTWQLAQGASLQEALEAALVDLDGFYTFAIGTRDGFAVLRDPIACKPAVIAETDDWVAMASEYRAIAQLPGNEKARIWEPEPGKIYSWEMPRNDAGNDYAEKHGGKHGEMRGEKHAEKHAEKHGKCTGRAI